MPFCVLAKVITDSLAVQLQSNNPSSTHGIQMSTASLFPVIIHTRIYFILLILITYNLIYLLENIFVQMFLFSFSLRPSPHHKHLERQLPESQGPYLQPKTALDTQHVLIIILKERINCYENFRRSECWLWQQPLSNSIATQMLQTWRLLSLQSIFLGAKFKIHLRKLGGQQFCLCGLRFF